MGMKSESQWISLATPTPHLHYPMVEKGDDVGTARELVSHPFGHYALSIYSVLNTLMDKPSRRLDREDVRTELKGFRSGAVKLKL